jgi:DNA-binding protein
LTQEKGNAEGADTTVYIGKKNMMNYVLAVTTRFNNGATQVTIKARGRAISIAVDVEEVVRKKYVKDAVIDDVRLFTEVLEGEGGKTSNVSAIEIVLKK